MQLKKITSVEADTTDGKRMIEGKNYIIIVGCKGLCGMFRGINKKSALMFGAPVDVANIEFNIMPNSISEIYEVEINAKRGFLNSQDRPLEEETDEG